MKQLHALYLVLGIIALIAIAVSYSSGYNKGYEDAIDRLYEIKKKTETGSKENPFSTIQRGLDAAQKGEPINITADTIEWITPADIGDTTIWANSSLKYMQLKIVGAGDSRMKMHAYFPNPDSTWSHYILY